MTKEERKILGETIKLVIRAEKHAWWQLKKEFDDGGAPRNAYGMFDLSIRRQLERLSDSKIQQLAEIIFKENGRKLSKDETIKVYENVAVTEIMRRAEIAASRTLNW